MIKRTSETVISPIKIMSKDEIAGLHAYMQQVVDYRKSGLSLNHIIGCPLDCLYCVRHFWDNFEMKSPHMLTTDEDAVHLLTEHQYFTPHKTPIQIFNRATDPFLKSVKPHTHKVLQLLDTQGLTNPVLVITRYTVTDEDMRMMESLQNVRVTLLFTYSGLNDKRIEPLPSHITLESIETAQRHKKKTGTALYWRPIVPGWNDDEETILHVLDVARKTDAIAYTGLFYRPQQQEHFSEKRIAVPYDETHRRKILPADLEAKILRLYMESGIKTPIFRKTSCAVMYTHELPDYNGHFGIQGICDICPAEQVKRCAKAYAQPTQTEFARLLELYEYETEFCIESGHVWTSGLSVEQRYHLQHTLGFQVWDRNLRWSRFDGHLCGLENKRHDHEKKIIQSIEPASQNGSAQI